MVNPFYWRSSGDLPQAVPEECALESSHPPRPSSPPQNLPASRPSIFLYSWSHNQHHDQHPLHLDPRKSHHTPD
ncbi:hypothetical protein E2C01_100972 [Portunus trituberculatus]|uniref:Uncharacterized protein n=1 Tax=Portunus trituberculatus TaxID=210409 RepID=A0A5B7K8C3_PORTR|nr:hypothetical protein [Portunus trituberculatus]